MALDRFVRFPRGRGPTKDDLGRLLVNFFDAGTTTTNKIEWVDEQSRWYVALPGHLSFPFAGFPEMVGRDRFRGDHRGRWIEVWLNGEDGTVDVMTREMDEYTNALAARVAEMVARFWEGDADDGT